jgi:hypothetical protein
VWREEEDEEELSSAADILDQTFCGRKLADESTELGMENFQHPGIFLETDVDSGGSGKTYPKTSFFRYVFRTRYVFFLPTKMASAPAKKLTFEINQIWRGSWRTGWWPDTPKKDFSSPLFFSLSFISSVGADDRPIDST